MQDPQMKTIRSKKLGVLIRDARQATGKTVKECAEAVGVPPATFRSYERGTKSPSLPQLEIFSYFLNVPLDHFWGSEAISEKPPPTSQLQVENLIQLRQEAIGRILEQVRTEAGLSLKEVASRTGLSARRLKKFETGAQLIPLPDLEIILSALDQPIKDFLDQEGPIRNWASEQDAIADFLDLPADLQAFVGKPINRPFLEVAQRLSQMPVDQLRSVAEGLLEITF
jgi:transcriptional regulator with XRE-family HTH domain